jgi:hypothetical protein
MLPYKYRICQDKFEGKLEVIDGAGVRGKTECPNVLVSEGRRESEDRGGEESKEQRIESWTGRTEICEG